MSSTTPADKKNTGPRTPAKKKPATSTTSPSSAGTPAKKTPVKKSPSKKTSVNKAPERIEEIVDREVVIEQAPEVATINLPAMPASLDASSSEAAMRAVLNSGATLSTGEIVVAEVDEVMEEVTEDSLPSRRERLSGEVASSPEPVSMLTPDRIMDAKKKADAPESGWRRAVYFGTFKLVNLGDSPAVRHRKAIDASIMRAFDGETRFVPVLTRKGGVGKTTVTTLLGMAMALVREDRVLAIDANPDRGTLAERFTRTTDKTVRDMVSDAAKVLTFNDFSTYVNRDKSRLDILASETDPWVSEAFGANDYNIVADLASRYYAIALTDCGTGIIHSVMSATLQRANGLVLVSGGSFDEARLAAETLTWLETNGYTELVRNSVVALNTATQGTNLVKITEIEDHFKSRVRETVRIPYDPMLAAGTYIDFKKLKPETQEAARRLASLVVDGLK